ncbi:MAG: hypothetical protein JNM76_03550 [Betaproteobacteria bacterium]|nr:hypothetical protein [Betaproteobacteria bacterium]
MIAASPNKGSRRATPALARSISKSMLGLLALCLAQVALASEPALPEGPASQKLSLWLAAFNADGAEAMTRHVSDHFATSVLQKKPAADIAAQFAGMRKQTGKLKLESASGDANAVRARVKSESLGIALEVSASVEPAAPHGILGVGVKPL